MNGKILFDMTVEDYPIYGGSKYLLKRWKRNVIYSKSGSYTHNDNIKENFYASSSTYLYDYVVVSKKFFESIVYTTPTNNSVPAVYMDQQPPGYAQWTHNAYTFKQTPNLTTNNYVLTSSTPNNVPPNLPGYKFIYDTYVQVDNGEYFEIVKGYPRNHFTHKRDLFSLYNIVSYEIINQTVTPTLYIRNRQTVDNTVGIDGLEDGSSPVQTTKVGNINLIQTTNVINE